MTLAELKLDVQRNIQSEQATLERLYTAVKNGKDAINLNQNILKELNALKTAKNKKRAMEHCAQAAIWLLESTQVKYRKNYDRDGNFRSISFAPGKNDVTTGNYAHAILFLLSTRSLFTGKTNIYYFD